ncbi:hypothetical protein G6M86_27880 (plasmid) [Agrobacterium tumefaciens]|uniref:Uncharacterized protein n=1 Tax=Agrobacterium tumefaciens TaxID=358 RepID=A0AAJ4TDK1_AGRTU|nr:hypothetical protein G6M86_27880 [Agrobacterium tumefaciens]
MRWNWEDTIACISYGQNGQKLCGTQTNFVQCSYAETVGLNTLAKPITSASLSLWGFLAPEATPPSFEKA